MMLIQGKPHLYIYSTIFILIHLKPYYTQVAITGWKIKAGCHGLLWFE